jgi:chromosomal replication initiation ATPase DnaA
MRQQKQPYNEQLVEQVEQIICDFFHTTVEEIKGYKKESILPTARYSLFYLLHERYGLSASQIALRYNRTPRLIFAANAQMKHFVKWDAYIIATFKDLLPLMP